MNVVISIIIPCYNQSEFLGETLQSVLDQNYQNWECIVVNDGSTDDTAGLIRPWLERDRRFRYYEKENGGLPAARNYGIEQAHGEYILPLDADDRISEDYVALGLECFRKDKALKLVYCEARKFGKENRQWMLPEFKLSGLAYQNMIFASAIFRKQEWSRVNGYDENMRWGYEDWEFWIALLKNGGKVRRLEHTGFFYRIKDSSMLQNMGQEKRREMYDYLSVKHADFFVAQLGSFFKLRSQKAEADRLFEQKLKSEKFVIDLFLYRFFRFTLFGKYKPD